MNEKKLISWIACPTAKKLNLSKMSLDELMELLGEKATAETAKVYGEIRGLYAAYKLAPSTVLLEAIIAKCLQIILNDESSALLPGAGVFTQNAKVDLSEPAWLWEWVNGFDYFLMLNKVASEKSRAVYIRALKRIMKNEDPEIKTVRELIDKIYYLIDKYAGIDRQRKENHNVHISALRKFKDYIEDRCGFFYTVEMDGKEEKVERV